MRGLLVAIAAVAAVFAWRLAPLVETRLLGGGEARAVTPRGDLAPFEETTVALFEAARGSVVFITTAGPAANPFGRNAFEVPRGSGSGFLFDDLGHVVTNAHVVEGAARATVRLPDGEAAPARLVGLDIANDLAVLKIAPVAAPALPLGTSADLRVGQAVFAIGNPFGLDFTLTTGIVSALDREISGGRGREDIEGLIQTDAAINPGNSGGPLLDSAGRLIGVNTAIFSPSGASAGIGFAVPVDTVARVVPSLIARGRYAPPVIGVTIDPRLDAIARERGLSGAAVVGVQPGGPAARAGLRGASQSARGDIVLGDVITAVEGDPIGDSAGLRAALDAYRSGDEVTLSLFGPQGSREVRLRLSE